MKIRQDVAEMLRAGATDLEIQTGLGVSRWTVRTARRALGMSARRTGAVPDDTVAQAVALLRAGTPQYEIGRRLGLGKDTVGAIRTAHGIPLPHGSGRPLPDDVRDQAVALLRAGITQREIRERLHIGNTALSALRKEHTIPVPPQNRGGHPRTITPEQAYARHTQPHPDGHLLWTGPRAGRMPLLNAGGKQLNARRWAFTRHHGRQPDGNVTPTCGEPDCITGTHLADRILRQQTPAQQTTTEQHLDDLDLDDLYDAIFGSHPTA